jgi:hypothetical protein
MYKISNEDGARDPDSVVRMLQDAKIKIVFDEEENEYIFPQLKKYTETYKVEEIKSEYPTFDLDFMELDEHISFMWLDHREMGYNLSSMMEDINSLLFQADLKLVDIDTRSDFMKAFITHKDAKTPEDMINESVNLNGNSEGFDINDYITHVTRADKSNNEMTAKEALRYVVNNASLENQTIDFELLKDFLEDTAPEFEYEIIERGDKTFISINEFDDEDDG